MTQKAVEIVAELMALSARTAPKGKGQDSILIRVVIGQDLQELSRELARLGQERDIKFFLRDARNLEESDACVLIAARSGDHAGLNCGGCGYASCQEMMEAQSHFLEAHERISTSTGGHKAVPVAAI